MDAPPNKEIRRPTGSPFTSGAARVSPHQVQFSLFLLDERNVSDIKNSRQAADSLDRDPLSSLHEGNSDKNDSSQSVSRKKKVAKDSAKVAAKKKQKKALLPNDSKKKLVLNDTARLMVSNVYKYVCKVKYEEEKREVLEFEEVKVRKNDCVLKTAEIIGISRTTVYKVLKDQKESEDVIVD